jgi:hypothetical protein
MMRLGWLVGLLGALACSACNGSALVAGCRIGGVDSTGNPCTPFNQPVGAKSHVPFDGIAAR